MADIIAHNQLSHGGRLIFPGQELVIIPAEETLLAEETLPVNLVRNDTTLSPLRRALAATSDGVMEVAVTDEIAGNPLLHDDDLWRSSDRTLALSAEAAPVEDAILYVDRVGITLSPLASHLDDVMDVVVVDTSASNLLLHDDDLWRPSGQELALTAEAAPAEDAILYVDRSIELTLSRPAGDLAADVTLTLTLKDAAVADTTRASNPSLFHTSHQLFHGKEEYDLALDRYIGRPELSNSTTATSFDFQLAAPASLDLSQTTAAPAEADPPATMDLH